MQTSRPRQAQRAKPLKIDFCIDARGVGVRVSEHVADLGQGGTGAQGPTHGLARRRACVPSVALDVADDIRVSNLAEIAGAGGTNLDWIDCLRPRWLR
ncbi:hypothetical protein CCR96_21795 [Halochromatium roseum]|nr:hypothetical protein [Halochromatium roseum]